MMASHVSHMVSAADGNLGVTCYNILHFILHIESMNLWIYESMNLWIYEFMNESMNLYLWMIYMIIMKLLKHEMIRIMMRISI